jgi:DNA-binding CsgD family transcriptional regulator/predicted nucleic acid-binding protein
MPQTYLARCLLEADDLDAAEEACAATGLGEDVPDVLPFISFLFVRMRLRARRGHHLDALADFDEARRRVGFADGTGPLVSEHLVAVGALATLERTQDASALLERALAAAARWGTPSVLGEAMRAKARFAKAEEAIETLRAAVDLLERSPTRLEHARALVDLGAALRRVGRRGEARAPLRQGYELARECAAPKLLELARSELAASGVRVRRVALTGADSLTPSERRIADLAAGGASNAEIAQALFVTVKTVEMHLTNAYRKMGIAGRPELTAALGGRR